MNGERIADTVFAVALGVLLGVLIVHALAR